MLSRRLNYGASILRTYATIRSPLSGVELGSALVKDLASNTSSSWSLFARQQLLSRMSIDSTNNGFARFCYHWLLLNKLEAPYSSTTSPSSSSSLSLGEEPSSFLGSILQSDLQGVNKNDENSNLSGIANEDSEVSPLEALLGGGGVWLSSTMKKRRTKMNKHKLKKRRKLLRMNSKQSRA